MSDTAADDALGLVLLNDCQRNFPLCSAPFTELARRLGVGEGEILRRLECLRREGHIARVGAVFAPKRIGASTLAAVAVPPPLLAGVVETVGRFPEVNHVVVREHRCNLWFIVTAGSEGRLQSALSAIEAATGLRLLRLPLHHDFGAGGPSASEARAGQAVRAGGEPASVPAALDEIGRRLVMALQEGLPLLVRPFSVLASRVGCDEGEVLERIRAWCADGAIKRFGVIERARRQHAPAQALWVLDVPEAEVADIGPCLAGDGAVALCYLRSRVLPDWPFNVFCTLEAESRADLEALVSVLRERYALGRYAEAVLYDLGHTPVNGGELKGRLQA